MILEDAITGKWDEEEELPKTTEATTPLEKFNRGLLNSNNTILSNMIAKKVGSGSDSGILSMLLSNQTSLIELLFMLISNLLGKKK